MFKKRLLIANFLLVLVAASSVQTQTAFWQQYKSFISKFFEKSLLKTVTHVDKYPISSGVLTGGFIFTGSILFCKAIRALKNKIRGPKKAKIMNPQEMRAKVLGQKDKDDEKKSKLLTGEDKQECYICGDEDKQKKDFVRLGCCGREICRDCIHNMVNLSKKEKDLKYLRCPFCKEDISSEDNMRVFVNGNQEDVETIANIKMHEWAKKQEGYKHCPTPDCKHYFINRDNVKREISCPECRERYCSDCCLRHSMWWTSCEKAKQNKLKKEGDLENEEWKKENTMACPMCNVAIEKNGGCNHMTCTNCKCQFCCECGYYTLAPFYGHPPFCKRPPIERNKFGKFFMKFNQYVTSPILRTPRFLFRTLASVVVPIVEGVRTVGSFVFKPVRWSGRKLGSISGKISDKLRKPRFSSSRKFDNRGFSTGDIRRAIELSKRDY
ncbi:IBR domain-containing protein [Candidatus Dependentiae bacterium]